jgi:glutamate racemase
VEVVSVPCGDLAMRIEDATIDEPLVEQVRGYCAPLREAGVDAVILGCTHYPLVRPIIQRMLGPEAAIITSGAPLARQVEHVLGTRGLDSPKGGEGSYGFLCTGEPAPFRAQGTRFLQLPLGEVERVRLGAPVGGAVAA